MNTSYLWESKLGLWAFPVFIFLFIFYIVLAITLIYQVYWIIKERFKNKKRNIIVVVMSCMLGIMFFWRNGIINFDKWEGNDLLIAVREGSANCTTTLKLKSNNKFIEKSICFGMSEVRGDYLLKGDSIFFSNVKLGRGESQYYEFAIIRPSEFQSQIIIGELKRFMNYNDTLPNDLSITKNELKN
jgi:hypothetical protein